MPFQIGKGGSSGSKGSGGKLDGDYKFKQNANGELELLKGNQIVSTQSLDGSWFKNSISTGVGSLHLGGNESGGMAHSLSSCGQNVGFKNEFSSTDPLKKMFFSPIWQATAIDGSGRQPASYRQYSVLNKNTQPNGAVSADIVVDYNFSVTFTANAETYSVTVLACENYTGKLQNVIISNVTSAEIYSTEVDVVAVDGSELVILYKYPFTTRINDSMTLKLVKADGSFLKVRAGVTDTTIPWRKLSSAPFTDVTIAAGSGYTASRALTSSASGGIAVSTTTTDELNSIGAAGTVYSIGTFTDSDAVYSRVGGQMRQTTVDRLFYYIRDKFTGAISTALTTNLPADKAVFTTSTGKLTTKTFTEDQLIYTNSAGTVASFGKSPANRVVVWDNNGNLPTTANTTTTEINQLSGTANVNSAYFNDGHSAVVNLDGVISQISMVSFWDYFRRKITGGVSDLLTGNLTADRILRSSPSGKIVPSHEEIVYKISTNSAGTSFACSNAFGGYSVYFTHTGTQVGISVTHTTTTMARYAYTYTSNGAASVNSWTSSSANLPVDIPKIAHNGASQIGTLCVSANSTLPINIHWSIVTNGAGISYLYARIS